MRTILIDADSVVFIAACANQTTFIWDEETASVEADEGAAKQRIKKDIEKMQDLLNADHAVLAFSNNDNPWRRKVLPEYKANRKDKNGGPPVLLKPLRDWVRETYTVFARPGMEGDDILGILGTVKKAPPEIKGERVICAVDKDLRSVPGLHYNWNRDEDQLGAVAEVSEIEADRLHMQQTLTGDTTDNYKGCPGIGPVKANKILGDATTVQEIWPLVVEAFQSKGLSEEDALVQARVARICRAQDFNFVKKEVKLWEPPR